LRRLYREEHWEEEEEEEGTTPNFKVRVVFTIAC
jgi:hypothetical protein